MLIGAYFLLVGWLADWINTRHDLLIWLLFVLIPFIALEVYAKQFWRPADGRE